MYVSLLDAVGEAGTGDGREAGDSEPKVRALSPMSEKMFGHLQHRACLWENSSIMHEEIGWPCRRLSSLEQITW